jgi:hypothetical protein
MTGGKHIFPKNGSKYFLRGGLMLESALNRFINSVFPHARFLHLTSPARAGIEEIALMLDPNGQNQQG